MALRSCCTAVGLVVAVVAWCLCQVYQDVWFDGRTPLDLRETQLWMESGRFLSFDGFAVWTRVAGPAQAPVVVLLHDYPGSSFDFADVYPRLQERYRTVVIDFLGCGASDKPGNFP